MQGGVAAAAGVVVEDGGGDLVPVEGTTPVRGTTSSPSPCPCSTTSYAATSADSQVVGAWYATLVASALGLERRQPGSARGSCRAPWLCRIGLCCRPGRGRQQRRGRLTWVRAPFGPPAPYPDFPIAATEPAPVSEVPDREPLDEPACSRRSAG